MLAALTKSIAKIFGTKQEKDIKAIQHLVDQIHVEYDKLSSLSHDALRQKTLEFKKRIADYISNFDQSISELRTKIQEEENSLEKEVYLNQIDELTKEKDVHIEEVLLEILPEAFAVVKEAARRFSTNTELRSDATELDKQLALTKNYIRNKYVDAQIYIIANDHDYLQLLDEHTEIVNFQNKYLKEGSKVFDEPQKNLFYKIVLGDKSDNINPIFKKCGPKTCEKYYENNELFLEALKKENAYEKYELNKKLVDFRELPDELVAKFLAENAEFLAKL